MDYQNENEVNQILNFDFETNQNDLSKIEAEKELNLNDINSFQSHTIEFLHQIELIKKFEEKKPRKVLKLRKIKKFSKKGFINFLKKTK